MQQFKTIKISCLHSINTIYYHEMLHIRINDFCVLKCNYSHNLPPNALM